MKLTVTIVLAVTLSLLAITHSQAPAANSAANATATPLCAFNSFGLVPGNKIHTYSVLNVKTANYTEPDFNVTWKDKRIKNHPFFAAVGRRADFRKSFIRMRCRIASKGDFGKICNYKPEQIDEYYKNAFGRNIIFKCQVPKNHFALNIRFVLKLDNFTTSAGGRWSVFGGLHKFKTPADAKKIIQAQGQRINKAVKSTKLNTFNINSELNIIPQFVQGTLAWVYNSNINSTFVKNTRTKTNYDIVDEGYIKVLPPGTPFIIGSIYNGTTSVKQICDNYRFKETDGCGLNLTQ